jgi:tetratricopeptide (TPR) repeat protein
MDRLDRAGAGAVALLLSGAAALALTRAPEEQAAPAPPAAAARAPSPIEPDLTKARELMESGSLDRAEQLVAEALARSPREPAAHLLRGELHLRRQDPLAAVLELREAVDLEPDYLDRRTPRFEGKKIKAAVGEAASELKRQLDAGKGTDALSPAKKAIHHLTRKMAGSCG